jgi:lysophospholipase L1-like esterase
VAAVLLCLPLQVVGQSSSSAAEPLRVLIVGDSVTQGAEGDWTWRYRLWKHLQATAEVPVDFVGPRDDLYDNMTQSYGGHAYVDPAFDWDHASRAGQSLSDPETPIAELVANHQVDVVVEMLGVIDLSFLGLTPQAVTAKVEDLVVDARSANPGVDVVVGEISQTWFPGVSETNALLPGIVEELDQPGSRVVLARIDPAYSADHTYDNGHPDAQGEVMIAAGFADALAQPGVGLGDPAPRPLPLVPLGPRLPAVLSGGLADGHAVLSWRRSPGAETTQVSVRDVTAGSPWTVVADHVTGTTWSSDTLPMAHRLEYRVLPRKGKYLALPDIASNVVSVETPGPPGRPRPTVTQRSTGKVLLSWPALTNADSYAIRLKRRGHRGWRVVAEHHPRPRFVLRGLRPGRAYVVRVMAENVHGAGPWSRAIRFTAP